MFSSHSPFHTAFAIVGVLGLSVAAQSDDTPPEAESNFWFYVFLLMLAAGIGAGLYFWRQSKISADHKVYSYQDRSMGYYNASAYDIADVDAAEEIEWLKSTKKAKSPGGNAGHRRDVPSANESMIAPPGPADQDTTALREKLLRLQETRPVGMPDTTTKGFSSELTDLDTRVFQEKMRRLQYTQLPINSFSQLAPAKNYLPLATSDDPSLLTAIEQVNEEFEEDESIREVAVRILAAFKNRNSIEALAQIALYDLSSSLRSKAVTTLTDFDHESVFETILLACADPTREVRAAAARGLFRLGFDRAHAWKRLIEAGDNYRMTQAARAAVESGIVTKSMDRLVHDDAKIAYEAFALTSLLIKAGETELIFDALRNHKDERVKLALLHVLKVHRDDRTLFELNRLRAESALPDDISERLLDTIRSFEQVAV